jgi:putative transposase
MAVSKQVCKLCMDGKRAWRDNVFIARLGRGVKNERVYLMACDCLGAARTNIAQYFDWYSTERSHSSLQRSTPDKVYQALLPNLIRAA